MSFVIDQELCAKCGSCIGNCPNRAIIRRADEVFVTEMCCDCGICVQYCTMGAIGKGSVRAEQDTQKLAKALKEKLSLFKNIAAMQYVDKAPEGVPQEKGPHFWCGICGDVFDEGGAPVLFSAKASTCGGVANLGLGAIKATREEFDSAINAQVVGEGNLYATRDVMSKNRNRFPHFSKVYAGVVIGSLEHMRKPDLVLFPVNGHQLCMISTAYAFDTGELITGFAGKSTCLMTISTPLMQNRPVFCAGDHGGRMFMRLKDDEILVCFPFSLIPGLVKNLDRTVFAQK